MFRDYNNFDVDNYIRDADVVDLSRIFSESSDIHQQTANCLNSSQPNCRLNYPVKIRTCLGTPPKEAAKKSQQTCFFCDETDDNLRRAATLTLDSKARAAATRFQDQKLLTILAAGDMPAIDSYYHTGCLTALYNPLRSISLQEDENITTQVSLEAIALAEQLVAYIKDNAKQTVFKLSALSNLYSSIDLSNQELVFSSGLFPRS